MKSVFSWYVYALLGLFVIGLGVSSVIQGNSIQGGAYVVIGLLVFGISMIGNIRRNQADAPPPDNMVSRVELISLIEEGREVEAIRRYRVMASCDLLEAKTYIDQLRYEIGYGTEEKDKDEV